VIERAVILSPGPTLIVDEALGFGPQSEPSILPLEPLDAVERTHILAVLEACHWHIKGAGQAAERLGLHPSTLYSRMRKLGIQRMP
jgi:transcriptional regulator of acetoin/glycerol metabolism